MQGKRVEACEFKQSHQRRKTLPHFGRRQKCLLRYAATVAECVDRGTLSRLQLLFVNGPHPGRRGCDHPSQWIASPKPKRT